MDTDMGSNVIGKYMSLFMNRMVGTGFDRALLTCKSISKICHTIIPQPYPIA